MLKTTTTTIIIIASRMFWGWKCLCSSHACWSHCDFFHGEDLFVVTFLRVRREVLPDDLSRRGRMGVLGFQEPREQDPAGHGVYMGTRDPAGVRSYSTGISRTARWNAWERDIWS